MPGHERSATERAILPRMAEPHPPRPEASTEHWEAADGAAAALDRKLDVTRRAEATRRRAEATLRRVNTTLKPATAREAEADQRDRIADARQDRGRSARATTARARLDVAELADLLAVHAETVADYFEEHVRDRGDADRRHAFAESERQMADVLRRNAASLRAGGHTRLEHLPELPAPPTDKAD